jgi:hypothetical protein
MELLYQNTQNLYFYLDDEIWYLLGRGYSDTLTPDSVLNKLTIEKQAYLNVIENIWLFTNPRIF